MDGVEEIGLDSRTGPRRALLRARLGQFIGGAKGIDDREPELTLGGPSLGPKNRLLEAKLASVDVTAAAGARL